ncbi:MAG: hypothetical protein Kow0058_03390 [Roseovarius sp.]
MALCALGLLAACAAPAATPPVDPTMAPEPPVLTELPPEVIALAAPNQDLSTVRLMPQDRCYWYMHQGPVETVLVPLRAHDGNLICLRPVGQTS